MTPITPSTPDSLDSFDFFDSDSSPSSQSSSVYTTTTLSGATKTLILSSVRYQRPPRPLASDHYSEIDNTEGPEEYLKRNQPTDNSESSMLYDRLYSQNIKPKTNIVADKTPRFAMKHDKMRSAQQQHQQRQYYYKQQYHQTQRQQRVDKSTDKPIHSHYERGRLENIME